MVLFDKQKISVSGHDISNLNVWGAEKDLSLLELWGSNS